MTVCWSWITPDVDRPSRERLALRRHIDDVRRELGLPPVFEKRLQLVIDTTKLAEAMRGAVAASAALLNRRPWDAELTPIYDALVTERSAV